MCASACLANLQPLVPGRNTELNWITETLNQPLAFIKSPLISAHWEQSPTHASDFWNAAGFNSAVLEDF